MIVSSESFESTLWDLSWGNFCKFYWLLWWAVSFLGLRPSGNNGTNVH